MYIIDQTYFAREIRVPGIQELRSEELDNLNLFIDEKAREILQQALGFTLFNDLDSQIIDGQLRTNPAPDPRWSRLVSGYTYTLSGEEFRWQGLAFSQGAYKKSLLAFYTFYFFLEDHVSQLSTLGEVQGKSKNAPAVNSTQKYIKAWNKFVELYQGDYQGYYSGINRVPNVSIKRGVPYYDYAGDGYDRTNFVSLLRYLSDNATDYPNAALRLYDYKNQLGI